MSTVEENFTEPSLKQRIQGIKNFDAPSPSKLRWRDAPRCRHPPKLRRFKSFGSHLLWIFITLGWHAACRYCEQMKLSIT